MAAVAARSALVWAQGTVSARVAATVKAALRADLLGAVGRHGPGWVAGQRAGQLATLAGRGLDALDAYFTGYLPQLVLSVTVPLAVLARIVFADWSSALIIALTLPLIPVFGALLGWQAQAATERQWRRLSLLGGHFLDMVAGLPTLRAFGRARAQTEVVRRMADGHRVATMKTLRIAFLSALVLELVATLSVALVAVPVGIRLLGGGLTLQTALLVLLLTPEAYLPLRAAGSRFHASMEGLTALDEALTVSAAPRRRRPPPRARPPPDGRGEIRFESVTVAYERTTALRDVTLTIRPGERIAVIGPSGAGKSTLLGLLLGFVTPTSRPGHRRRGRPGRRRPGRLAPAARLGAAAGPPLRRLAGRQHPARRAGHHRTTRSPRRSTTPRWTTWSPGCRTGWPPCSASAGTACPAANGSGWRWPARSSGTPRWCCSTSPPPGWTPPAEAVVLDATRRLVAGRTALLVAHRPALLADADRILRIEDGRVTELTPEPTGKATR